MSTTIELTYMNLNTNEKGNKESIQITSVNHLEKWMNENKNKFITGWDCHLGAGFTESCHHNEMNADTLLFDSVDFWESEEML